MTVENFVDEYRKLVSRKYTDDDKKMSEVEKFIDKHIVTSYINFEEKDALCRVILDKTTYSSDNKFKKNSPARYLQFMLTLVSKYTDVEISGDNALVDFNLLNKNGLIQLVTTHIPKSEYAEFNTVMNMINDDIYDNERNITSFLETKFDTLSMVLDSMLEAYNEVLSQQDKNTTEAN